MVFHCRCLSFTFKEEEEEEIQYETATQVQSTSTHTFHTALSNFNLKEFTFSELKAATNNFSQSAKIREGWFGYVYMGMINNPLDSTKTLDVAVKRLSREGLQEWLMEVNVLGVVDHPNLVKLVGYCAEDDEIEIQLLLVYEYMPNRSVDDQLSRNSEAPLSWTMRLKVAQDVARGLTYLHEQMDCQIIFRDLKSSNILLDDQWNAKLSDFGLAHLGPEEGLTHVSTTVVGTIGYTAPEYIQTGRLTSKVDVWSYGVFLYELITGRRPMDRTRPKNEQKLLEWVKPYVGSKRFRKIIDPRLEGKYSLKSANELASIAGQCLSIDPMSRPKMSEALEMINQLITTVPSQTPRLNSLMGTLLNPPAPDSNLAKKTSNPRVFTFAELKAATKNFKDDSVAGYKGVIKSLEHPFRDIQVTVKFAHGVLMQEPKEEWLKEVDVLGMVDHPNLVKLIGYCLEDNELGIQRLLVYEYMSNRSIEYHLSTRSEASLSWTMRLKVAQDVARGLAYLNDIRVISGDFKSSNILLDDQWNAKLTEFGVAGLDPEERLVHISTMVVGTMGYAAPEYIKTGHLSSTSDVWSYGVFLYELITGRLPFDRNRPKNEQKLLEWVNPYIGSERFESIIDPRLQGNYSLESVQKLSFIANRCLYMHPKSRPKMSEVQQMVNQLASQATNPAPPLKRGSTHKEPACFSRICCVS